MNESKPRPATGNAEASWKRDYAKQTGEERPRRNRSGIAIKPLYGPEDWKAERFESDLGWPGEQPMTRGIYASMYRGRPWSQRQLVGLGTAFDFNRRQRAMIEAGASALSLCPCNSVYRGFDMDEVDSLLLGTCGVVVNSANQMSAALDQIPLDRISIGLNDPLPFTLFAFMLAHAKKAGTPWEKITGTSNQSDYISHFVANHMFFRLALPGSRRVLVDHIAWCNKFAPNWNPLSVVGQHMQQAGATPAQAMGFALCTAIQYAEDCLKAGMAPDSFLPRFSFFFDISISFFEEIAKFRAGRRLWARIARDRLGAKDSRSWRFKFHAQTSGVDLTRQQPLNNIIRVAIQAMSGIFGGLQSMHTDAYDEVLSSPVEEAARIALATQNILREEAHLDEVIDPLGGSFYVESLTNRMEEEIASVIEQVDQAGGMFEAVKSGLVQRMIGESALAWQEEVESGRQKVVGVNGWVIEETPEARNPLERPDEAFIAKYLADFAAFKQNRSQEAVAKALDGLSEAANDSKINIFGRVVEAAETGCSHGEIVGRLRKELGFGHPLVIT
jgi:methylmalonyl-CoA mutase N-terminal domain/subunit